MNRGKLWWIVGFLLLVHLVMPSSLSSQTQGCQACIGEEFCIYVADGFGWESCSIKVKYITVDIAGGQPIRIPFQYCALGNSCALLPGSV